MNLTLEQVLSYAPDEGVKKRGQSTAKLSKWLKLGGNDRAIWGECKGSGAQPYLVGVDFNGMGFKCGCPAMRKPPCKHVMALMILYVQFSEQEFQNNQPPQWMFDWLAKRDEKAQKTQPTAVVSDEEARKREEKRVANFRKRVTLMKNGFADIEIWLNDLIRQGIASVEKQSYSFWNDVAARLVDTKSRGAGNFIKEIPLLINVQSDWYETVIAKLADVYTIAQAFKHIEELPTALQHDVLSVAGYTIPAKDLLLKAGVKDDWQILGKIQGTGIDENLIFRRVWLKGQESGKYALVLDFAHVTFGSFDTHWSVGSQTQNELVYFPSNYPTRVKVKQQFPISSFVSEFDGSPTFDAFLDGFSAAVAANPWLMDFPCMLNQVMPIMRDEKLMLIDSENTIVPVADREMIGWKLLALSGGNPISIFGEWTGSELIPLSAMVNNRFVDMSVNRVKG